MRDRRQKLAGVPVEDLGDVAVPASQRGLVDQQDRAGFLAPLLSQTGRPRLDQGHDRVPRESVAPRYLGDRQLSRVLHDHPRQTSGDLALDHRVGLGVALGAVVAGEPPPQPDEGHRPAADREVLDPLALGLVNLGGPEPTEGTAPHRTQILDHDLKAFREI